MATPEAYQSTVDQMHVGKPVIAYDLDGTLLVPHTEHNLDYQTESGHRGLFCNPAVGTAINELAQSTDQYYLSMRGILAHSIIGRQLGINPLGIIAYENIGSDHDAMSRAAALDEQFSGRSILWVDDVVGPDQREWARTRTIQEAPTMLLKVHPELGVQSIDMRRILRWARMQTAARANTTYQA